MTLPPHRARLIASALALSLMASAPAVSVAAGGDAKSAKRFAKKGKKAYKAQRWDDAISAFRLAHEIDPQPKFLFNIARCLAKNDDLAGAVEEMERYVEDETDEDERADGEDELRILRKRLKDTYTQLVADTMPPGAAVVLKSEDREIADTSPMDRWIPAGAWTMTVSLPGYATYTEQVVARPGENVSLDVTLETATQAAATGAVATPPDAAAAAVATPPPPAATPVAPWVIGSAGVIMLLGGVVASALVVAAVDDREALQSRRVFYTEIEDANDVAKSRAVAANILYGLGATALVSGVGLQVLMQSAESSAGASAGWSF